MNNQFWIGKKVLITGHTGFKGGWLSLLLQNKGAEILGYALEPPTQPNLFTQVDLEHHMASVSGNIRDIKHLKRVIADFKPEIIFHLAAQSLVRESYRNPRETFEINIMGTVNLLDAVRECNSVRAIVNVTSDKCYENKEWVWSYRENDPIGGRDPYSCSKGCSELITSSFRQSFLNELGISVASVRAGNVIGGGDWSQERLVPDIVKAIIDNAKPVIRNPLAIRPWQYVLEPLSGYILLAEKLFMNGIKYGEPWNFGPPDSHVVTVGELTNLAMQEWGTSLRYEYDQSKAPYETQVLKLDSSKARMLLGWETKLDILDTIKWTVDWYQAYASEDNLRQISLEYIQKYEKLRGE